MIGEHRAIITGAGQRLGRAMALYLAQRGYDVALHYQSSAAQTRQLADQISEMGVKALPLQADLRDEAACQALIGRAAQGLGGPLNCLINNAAVFDYDTLQTADRASWDRHMQINLRAPFVLTQNFAAQAPKAVPDAHSEMLSTALIVNMLDQRVQKLTPEFTSYTISKMGLWAFTQTAAQALAPDVRINAIGPGPTLRAERQSEDHFKRQRDSLPLRRGAHPQDITAALGYFLDAVAVTGQLICVDGGQNTAWQTPEILGFSGENEG
ncbi:MAG: short chain dehydrogenase [Rhodobacterales bacterium]|nr:MAG: short chain dehydrogenase [Rhodobacterales bacterium]